MFSAFSSVSQRNTRLALGLILASATGFHVQPVLADAGFAKLLPHRAVYEVKLIEASERSGIASMDGRIVYEMTGSACQGASVRYRFVARINARGNIYTADEQMASWESADGNTYQFVRKSMVNDQVDEQIKGAAERTGSALKIELSEPEPVTVEVEDAVFISAHLVEILDKAREGAGFFRREVYDASDEARTTEATSNVIGPPRIVDEVLEGEKEEAITLLEGRQSWPVTIAYFDEAEANAGESLPDYEVSFLLYDGGITRKVEMRYPDYSLMGSLVSLEMLPVDEDCKSGSGN